MRICITMNNLMRNITKNENTQLETTIDYTFVAFLY